LLKGVRHAMDDMEGHVRGVLASVTEAEAIIARRTGLTIQGMDVLEIGTGQLPRQTAHFARNNRVTGIDLDVIPAGFSAAAYWRMFRRNGPLRVVKTLARKGLGYDARFCRQMARQLGLERVPPYTLRQMDAANMQFADNSFDFAYSFDVMEHIPEPAAVLHETVRVLRPGGLSYQSIHIITAEDGFHDARIISNERAGIPFWAHLRQDHRSAVTASAYLNELRIGAWENILREVMPGVEFEILPNPDAEAAAQLKRLREAGELPGFTDEELLARRLVAIWRKPSA
jgi:SAM-dependent methyltransferase